MSKIALAPNASGTGTFTIAAPNSNTDRTLTLPDVAGEVVVNEGSGAFKIDSSGNVGIGTSSPSVKLDVVGSISSSGSITTPSQPSIYLQGQFNNYVNFSAGQQYLVSTYYYQTYVHGGMSWNSGTGRVTVPTDGRYLLSFGGYETGSSGRVQIRKNASMINLVQWFSNGTNGESFTLQMSANDYIDIIADGFDLPSAYIGYAHTHFSLDLLG